MDIIILVFAAASFATSLGMLLLYLTQSKKEKEPKNELTEENVRFLLGKLAEILVEKITESKDSVTATAHALSEELQNLEKDIKVLLAGQKELASGKKTDASAVKAVIGELKDKVAAIEAKVDQSINEGSAKDSKDNGAEPEPIEKAEVADAGYERLNRENEALRSGINSVRTTLIRSRNAESLDYISQVIERAIAQLGATLNEDEE